MRASERGERETQNQFMSFWYRCWTTKSNFSLICSEAIRVFDGSSVILVNLDILLIKTAQDDDDDDVIENDGNNSIKFSNFLAEYEVNEGRNIFIVP